MLLDANQDGVVEGFVLGILDGKRDELKLGMYDGVILLLLLGIVDGVRDGELVVWFSLGIAVVGDSENTSPRITIGGATI